MGLRGNRIEKLPMNQYRAVVTTLPTERELPLDLLTALGALPIGWEFVDILIHRFQQGERFVYLTLIRYPQFDPCLGERDLAHRLRQMLPVNTTSIPWLSK